jgi:hypothetical protein
MLRERKEPPSPVPEADEVAFIRQKAGVYLWLDFRIRTRQAKVSSGKALHHSSDKPGLVEATVPKPIPVGIGKQHHIVAP